MKLLYKFPTVLLIFSLGVIVYSNTFHCPFHFDDNLFIINNAAIKDIHNVQNIWSFLPCRFIFYLSLALNYHLHQLGVLGYHILNIAIHLISALLVWRLVLLTLSTPAMKDNKITTHANLIALLTGLIFVSHPIQTQAVTYIMQRSASLATLFYLASLIFYIKARLQQNQKSSSSLAIFYYSCSLLVAVLAMFTKEISITLPLMILLYEFFFFKPTIKNLNWKFLLPFLLTLLIIPATIALSPKVLSSQELRQTLQGFDQISSDQYVLTQFRALFTYIRLLLFPLNQNLDYDYPVSQSLFELPTLFSFLSLIFILFFAIRLYSKYRLLSFCVSWFFLTLLPELSPFPVKDVFVEYRLYLPSVGYSLFLVGSIFYLFGKSPIQTMAAVLAIVIGCNSFLTYERNKVWKDDVTLWNDTVEKSPHKARPYNNRGLSYYNQNNFAQALSDYNKAIEINPNYADAFNNRGIIYSKQGNLTQATSDFIKVITMNPHYAKAYNNCGLIYSQQNKFTEAIAIYGKAIEINPAFVEAYNNRGIVYDKQNNLIQAISDYNKAIEISPNFAEAYVNRGNSYNKQENLAQAISDFNKAIEINPNYAEAYNNWGLIYAKQNNFTKAIATYTKAIEINPQSASAYNNRGIAYSKQGNFAQAISDFNKAIEINPKYIDAYSNRGVFYDSHGNLSQAISDYTKVIEINPNYAGAYYNRGLSYDNQGNLTQAISDFNKAIEKNPHYAEAYYDRGLAYSKQDNLTQAILDNTKALEISPKYVEAYNNRAVFYYQLKDYAKAWDDVHKIEALGHAPKPEFIEALKKDSGRDQ